MEDLIKKTEENYQVLDNSNVSLKHNRYISPDILIFAVLQAKGILTEEENIAIKNYVLHGEM